MVEMKICVVRGGKVGLTETFIRAHVERLPGEVTMICGSPPHFAHEPRSAPGVWLQMLHRAYHMQRGRPDHEKYTAAYTRLLSRERPDAVLAEYGTNALKVLKATRSLGIPLIAHFHGFDASKHEVLERYGDAYRDLFNYAAAVIGVSRPMCKALVGLGADPARVHYNPCGVDTRAFVPANPAETPPTFVAVGRLVDKKAPHLVLLAFAETHRRVPEARLRVVGDGPLMGVCKDMVSGLGLADAVDLLGSQPHEAVRREMNGSRAFVQHSVIAESGDSEGTPVSVMEAGAAGLPVVATRHAGIPEVVKENETGILVDERDVDGMSRAMTRLARDPDHARDLGRAARCRVVERFDMDRSIRRLNRIIRQSVSAAPPAEPRRPTADFLVESTHRSA